MCVWYVCVVCVCGMWMCGCVDTTSFSSAISNPKPFAMLITFFKLCHKFIFLQLNIANSPSCNQAKPTQQSYPVFNIKRTNFHRQQTKMPANVLKIWAHYLDDLITELSPFQRWALLIKGKLIPPGYHPAIIWQHAIFWEYENPIEIEGAMKVNAPRNTICAFEDGQTLKKSVFCTCRARFVR